MIVILVIIIGTSTSLRRDYCLTNKVYYIVYIRFFPDSMRFPPRSILLFITHTQSQLQRILLCFWLVYYLRILLRFYNYQYNRTIKTQSLKHSRAIRVGRYIIIHTSTSIGCKMSINVFVLNTRDLIKSPWTRPRRPGRSFRCDVSIIIIINTIIKLSFLCYYSTII